MKASVYWLMAAILFGFSGFTQADDDFSSSFYGGLDYSQVDVSQGSVSAEPTGVRARLGYRWSKHLAIEGYRGFGAKEDDIQVSGVDVGVDIESYYGIYLRGIYPVGEKFNLYGIVGYSSMEVDNFIGPDASGSLDSVSDSDYGYGFAADYNLFQKIYLSAEYMRMIDSDKLDVDAINIGIRVDFE